MDDVPAGVDETLAALIATVVVGHAEMGDAMTVEGSQPFGFASEDKPFEDGSMDSRDRTFEIGYDEVALSEDGVDPWPEDGVDTPVGNELTDATVEQQVPCKGDVQGICCQRWYR